ncbi:hypothetical protein [Sulfuricurvum sp.]|uniref:hypothetical protein n=1 Tax=Sulfuricurvum sp. TaxID=2025608 RepID=UPI0035680627
MGTAMIVKTYEAWLNQAKDAQKKLEECGAKNLNEFNEKDHQNFCKLIEALYALKVPIDQDLMQKAEMRPVDELFS